MAAEDFLLGFSVGRAEAELLSMGALSLCTRAKEKKIILATRDFIAMLEMPKKCELQSPEGGI